MSSIENSSSSAESKTAESKSSRTNPAAPPTADQLASARAAHWHQDQKPLLSQEALRDWIGRSGLVAYGPRAQQLGAPAPSVVEATAGKKLGTDGDPDSGLDGAEAVKTLLARLIAEGSVVPLSLLGASGGLGTDVPDYVASAAVFSFIFTLRGNKAWKQPPVTAGPLKVSPLALAVYEMLAAKVTMSAYDLATQLGKEVTEGAVLRALTELWGQLRVLPVPQLDGSVTLWELTSARFTKQIKAGANAGQPSALSALISLYLGQAIAATEDEIETFLSPLAARSRVREVIHALLSARQLETFVVEGRTLLHVAGELPGFAAAAAPAASEATAGDSTAEAGDSRITKFAARPGSKIGTGLRSKPAFGKKPGFGGKPGFASKPYGSRPPAGDRERRPFKRAEGAGPARPAFDKPWSEDRAARPEGGEGRPPRREFTPRPRAAEGSAEAGGAGGDAPRRTFSKPGTFGRKREGGAGFDRGEGRPPRREGGERPQRAYSERPSSDRPRSPRPSSGRFGADRSGSDRPGSERFSSERSGSSRPGGASFKRPGGGAGSYASRPRPVFGGKPAFTRDRGADAEGGQASNRGEATGRGDAPKRVYRKFDAPREKKPFSKSSGPKPAFGAKPAFGGRPARDSSGEGRPERGRPERERPERARAARSFDGPRPRAAGFDRPGAEAGDRRPRPSFGARPGAGPGAASGGARSGSGRSGGEKSGGKKPFAKAGGPFAKFSDGKKPFRKPGPGKSSASGGRPAGGGGGFKPVKRKRPEGNG